MNIKQKLLIYLSLLIIVLNIPNIKHFILYNQSNKDINETLILSTLNSNNKDVIIILDTFNINNNHGRTVFNFFNGYFDKYLHKNIDIKTILLNINDNDLYSLDLLDNDYNKLNINQYNLEAYISKIKSINVNVNIVLSLSIMPLDSYSYINDLMVKYNIKLVNAYFNNFDSTLDYLNYIRIYFDFPQNGLFVSKTNLSPFGFSNYIDLSDFNIKTIDLYPTSYLTPILAYEYYFNNDVNKNKGTINDRNK